MQGAQTITFGGLTDRVFRSGQFSVSATGGVSGVAVLFASTTPAVCTVTGSTVTLAGVGLCTIQVSQAGSADYLAAMAVSQSFHVTQATQSITFAPIADRTYDPTPFPLSATGGASGNPIVFTPVNPAVCTVTGSAVTMAGPGLCAISADQAGNTNYQAAPTAFRNFRVNQATQTIVFTLPATMPFTAVPIALSATGGASGLPVVFTSPTPGICKLSGTVLTLTSLGSCSVLASQAGNASYLAAEDVHQNLTVNQAPQTIAFGALTDRLFGTPSFTLSATGGLSGQSEEECGGATAGTEVSRFQLYCRSGGQARHRAEGSGSV